MKLKATLPKDELNGLTLISQKAQKLGTKVLIVGLVESISVTDELGKPSKDVKFELQRVEVVDTDDEAFIAGMIEDAFQARTGKTPLDINVDGAEDLRRRYKPRGDRKPKAEASVFAEPSAIKPLRLDPAVLAPDEDPDVIDAEVDDEPASSYQGWEHAATDDDEGEDDNEDEEDAPSIFREPENA